MKVKKQFSIFLGLFLLFLLFAPSVLAVSGKPKVTGKPVGVGNTRVEGKLKACQAKENSVKKRMSQLEKMATNMLEKFNEIQGRVEKYYTEKVLPSGKVVANHGALTADIELKKAAVQAAILKVQTSTAGFSCTGNNPKEQMKQFNDGMREVKSALKDYRTSIRNLIVAVRSVTGETKRNVTVSPKPTKVKGNSEI